MRIRSAGLQLAFVALAAATMLSFRGRSPERPETPVQLLARVNEQLDPEMRLTMVSRGSDPENSSLVYFTSSGKSFAELRSDNLCNRNACRGTLIVRKRRRPNGELLCVMRESVTTPDFIIYGDPEIVSRLRL
jgi:hypothetical protein